MPPFRSLLPAFAFFVPTLAFAQAQPGGGSTPAPAATDTAAPEATSAAARATTAPPASAAPAPVGSSAASGSAPEAGTQDDQAKQVTPATGYGYDDRPRRRRAAGTPRRVTAHASGPIATLPGFEMLADGGSRLFVQLTQNVPVEEKRAAGTVTYVLKGAHVTKYNNERPLVTVHFNTPVSRARLIPSGRDLLFIVDLRANVQPTWKIESAKNNTAVLAIDFPKGDFIPSGGPTDDTQQRPVPKPGRAMSKKKG
jgi:hypothetical protein